MHTTRRVFLKNSALAVTGTTLLTSKILAAPSKNETLGVQLYSVREEMKNDPSGTLKQLAGMGYKNVEHANYVDRKFYGYSAKEFKKLLSDLGLKMPSGHTVMKPEHWNAQKKQFSDAWKQTIEDAATVGQKYVISPWMDESLRKSYDDMLTFLEVFNQCGQLCQQSGMKFGYHNHDFEFSQQLNGKILYDIILQNTDPKLVVQQMDMGNMVGGGGKAMDILKKYPGRFESMHVKDMIKSEEGHAGYESTILGKGLVDVKEVIDWGKKSGGTTEFIIEQESYQDKTPLESVKADLAMMKQWGYNFA